MRGLLEDLVDWLVEHAGVWGTRFLVLLLMVVAYGLVWFAISSVRALFNRLTHHVPGENRLLIVVGALVRCAIAGVLLVWVVRTAVRNFPEWLGIR